MKCPRCDTHTPDESRFCMNCGAGVGSNIPASHRVDLERLIPRQYLEQLIASRGRPRGERRVVTIVFFDVKGSTAMAETLDPEDVMAIMNGAFETMIEPVYRYEGTLARLMGDGAMAFFGAPVAHEDDAARACRAGLEVLDRAHKYAESLENERGITGFDVRVGINTGLVAVGEVGADLRVEYTAMGDAVNLAARMESSAEPGTILITADTHRAVADLFETEDLGPVQVKGKKEPVRVYRLLRARVLGTGTRVVSGAMPLVGRKRELARIEDSIAEAWDGRGPAVVVMGEAGMGKSRLIAEARVGSRLDWREGRCTSYAEDIGYWIAREMLQGLIGVDWMNAPDDVAAALRSDPDCDEEYLFLAQLLGLTLDDDERALIANYSADALRARMARAWVNFAVARARREPLAILFEDFHWVDESSLELVEALASACADVPLLLVVACRPENARARGIYGRIVALAGGAGVIEIAPLDRESCEQLARHHVGDVPLPKALVVEVIDSAEGNAFFLEEVLKSLIEAEECVDSGWNVRSIAVPTTLHGAIQTRVDGLDPRDKGTLQTAAVIGRQFSRDVLADVHGPGLEESLDELERREFVQRTRAGSADAVVYTFRQAMTAEVAYNSLLKSQRADLHRRIGDAIERLFPGRRDELAPVLSHHFENAGVTEKAFEYLIRAARRAAGVSANRESIRRYRRALKLCGKDEPNSALTRIVSDVAAVHEEIADVYFLVANYASAAEHYDRAVDLLDDDRRLVTLHRKKGQTLQKWGKHDEARILLESARDHMRKPLDTTEAAHIYSGLGMARYHDRDLDGAVALVTRALEMMAASDNQRGVAQAHNNLGIIYGRRENWQRALDHHQRSLNVWQTLGDDYGLASAHNNLGVALRGNGRLDDALVSLHASVELFERIGNRHGLACVYDNIGQTHMDRAEPDDAYEYLKKAVAIMAEISVDKTEILAEMWQTGSM